MCVTYNLGKDQTALEVLAADTCDTFIRANSNDATDQLNLQGVKVAQPHFCL